MQRVPEIPFEKTILDNGLEVIVHHDPSTPMVAIHLWYHVGSKNEVWGKTGFAHLFEHLMFQGSAHCPSDFFLPIQKVGGRLNGSTSPDRTSYWEILPQAHWELGLWLESDRMGNLLPAVTPDRLRNQKEVVMNERRQRYENRPYGRVMETILAGVYPRSHPYHWPTIGSMDDIEAATMEDVTDFFHRYYHPSNASICVAGAIDPKTAVKTIERYFAWIAPGPKPAKMRHPRPVLQKPLEIEIEDRVSMPRLYLTWPSPALFEKDDAELDLAASILGSGSSSKLYDQLVRRRNLAQDVHVSQGSGELNGLLRVQVTPRKGVELDEIAAATEEELSSWSSQVPAKQELERAVTEYESAMLWDLTQLSGFGGRTSRLSLYNTYQGDPGGIQADFARYCDATPDTVGKAFHNTLSQPSMTLRVVPGKGFRHKTPLPESSESKQPLAPLQKADHQPDPIDRSAFPKAATMGDLRGPRIDRLDWGEDITCLTCRDERFPVTQVLIGFESGSAWDPVGKAGLARLTALNVDQGTKDHSSQWIASRFADLGAYFGAHCGFDQIQFRLSSLGRTAKDALSLACELLAQPQFGDEDFQRQLSLTMGQLAKLTTHPTGLASLAMQQIVFGEGHPYFRSDLGSPSSVASIEAADLRSYFESRFSEGTMTIIAVGGRIEERDVFSSLLDRWGKRKPLEIAAQTPRKLPPRVTIVDIPGAAQSVIQWLQHAPPRHHPDHYALLLLNGAFGGQFTSRLNLNLREDKGYTYGIRSQFGFRRQASTFSISTSVESRVTAAAVREIVKEYQGLCGDRPITTEELDLSKKASATVVASRVETPKHLSSTLSEIAFHDLPLDYWDHFLKNIEGTTREQVEAAARNHWQGADRAIVIAGDAAAIEPELAKDHDVVVCKMNDDLILTKN